MNNDYEYTVYENETVTKKGKKRHFSIKLNRLGFGLLLIACAVFIILDSVGVSLGFISSIPVVTLIIGALFLGFSVSSLIKLKFGEFFFNLAIAFMVFEKYIARFLKLESDNIINNWLVLLAALLLSIGVGMVFPKHSFIKISKNSGVSSGRSSKENNLSGGTVYIDCASFECETVENNLGGLAVYFTNVEAYKGGGVLNLENNLGGMSIFVPSSWRIESNIENSLGAVNFPKESDGDGKLLIINGENNLGAVSIKRV